MVIHVACLVRRIGQTIFLFGWMDICWMWRDRTSHFSFWLDGLAMLIMSYGTHLSFIYLFIYLLSKHNHVRSYFIDLIKTDITI
jgi:hypothetical protein